MIERGIELLETADGQISELIDLLCAQGAVAVGPCSGRESSDSTVAALALHQVVLARGGPASHLLAGRHAQFFSVCPDNQTKPDSRRREVELRPQRRRRTAVHLWLG